MSSIAHTSSRISAPRTAARRDTSYAWIMVAVILATMVACAWLATVYPLPAGVDAVFVGP